MLELSGTLAMLKRGDKVSIARDIAQRKNTLLPLELPAAVHLDPQIKTAANDGTLTELQRPVYAAWLASTVERSDILDEMQRRLRSSMWAQSTLADAEEWELANVLSDWHREQWGVSDVLADEIPDGQLNSRREMQIAHTVRLFASGSRRPTFYAIAENHRLEKRQEAKEDDGADQPTTAL
jgi:hypothetical protein